MSIIQKYYDTTLFYTSTNKKIKYLTIFDIIKYVIYVTKIYKLQVFISIWRSVKYDSGLYYKSIEKILSSHFLKNKL